jgi:LacI family transcriptional regulator
VARLAGVSPATVSSVWNRAQDRKLSDETRRRVHQAAQRLGYLPEATDHAPANGKTRRIGLVLGVGRERLSADSFLLVFFKALIITVHRHGYLTVVTLAEDAADGEDYLWLIREQQVDGLVLSGPNVNSTLLPRLARERFPLILHGRLKNSGFPCVDADNRDGAYRAVRHLIDLGHRRIGFISNAHFSFCGAEERFAGYVQALAEHDIAYDTDLIQLAAFLPATGKTAMEHLLRLQQPPTAVFAASDVIAVGAMSAIHSFGLRVPDDVAVVGYDDILLSAHANPPLTTVRVPADDLGRTAGESLIQLIEGDEDVSSVTLETELVIRESCGAKQASHVDRTSVPVENSG